MLTVGKFVFFFTFLVLETQGQITPSLVGANAYVSEVIDKLWERVKEYGLSNLPVQDVSVTFAHTPLGFELNGPVSFEDGFVQDIESVTMNDRNFYNSLAASSVTIGADIVFTNLKLYRDLRADLTTGLKVGTIVFTSHTLAYTLRFSKVYTNDTVVPTMSFSSQSGVDWDMIPDDMTTRLIRRQYLMANVAGPDFVTSTTTAWVPLFLEFLNEIVNSIDFPEVTF